MSAINQRLSLYIPRVASRFTSEQIAHVFEKFDLGCVRSVDLVGRMGFDGSNVNYYNSAYLHFDEWYMSDMVSRFQEKVYDGKACMFYDDPYSWKVFENRSVKQVAGQKRKCLDLNLKNPVVPSSCCSGSSGTNAAGALILKAIQKHNLGPTPTPTPTPSRSGTNDVGVRLLMGINSFTLEQCKQRICCLDLEIALMKQKNDNFNEKKMDSLSSEIGVMQEYFAKVSCCKMEKGECF